VAVVVVVLGATPVLGGEAALALVAVALLVAVAVVVAVVGGSPMLQVAAVWDYLAEVLTALGVVLAHFIV
jgi:flagellar motor component MotA